MGAFCITRRQFIDRSFTAEDLAALVEMLRHWFRQRAGEAAMLGDIAFSAKLFAFPRTETDAIMAALSSRLPRATIRSSDPHEIHLSEPPQPTDEPPNLRLWTELLAEPATAHACDRLFLVFRGRAGEHAAAGSGGTTTFVLCGAPSDGGFLLKAMWSYGADENFARVFEHVAWDMEQAVLYCFDEYQRFVDRGDLPESATHAAIASF